LARERNLNSNRLERWVRALQGTETSQPWHPLYAWRVLAMTNNGTAESLALSWQALAAQAPSAPVPKHAPARRDTRIDFRRAEAFSDWTPDALASAPRPAGQMISGPPAKPITMITDEACVTSAGISARLEGALRSPTFTLEKRYVHILAAGS